MMGCGSSVSPSKPVVFVIGASGKVGTAAAKALCKYGKTVDIKVGVRDPSKATHLQELPGVTVVKATMGDTDELKLILQGVHALFLVVPGTENRADLSISTLAAAKEAEVKYVVVLSVTAADDSDLLFGKQFQAIEKKTVELQLPFTILRLPTFLDNYLGFQQFIKSESSVFCPVDPDKPQTTVAIADVGKAAAAILKNPTKHAGKTYTLISNRHTYGQLTKEFSTVLGKKINYVRVSYQEAKQQLREMGYPDWQADGVIEHYKLVDAGSPMVDISNIGDLKRITGQAPTNLKTWLKENIDAFTSD